MAEREGIRFECVPVDSRNKAAAFSKMAEMFP